MKRTLKYILPLLFLILFQLNVISQTRYILQTVDITVPTVLDLQITSGANPTLDFNQTSILDNGISLLGATSFTYKSNSAWFATIKAGNASFTGGVAGSPMPASVISYRINGTGAAYTPLSNIEQTLIASTGSKNLRGAGSGSIDFKINPGYIYPPAQNYSLQIIYTISNL